jgi:hypothetical protein
MPDVQCRL